MTTPNLPGGGAELAGRTVARIGFGAMQLAELRGQPAPPTDTAIAVLRRAVELGIDHVDTAQFYGNGRANELIREALGSTAADLSLVSKVGAEPAADGGLVAAQRPEQLRAAVEANLRTLDVERLAVVNMRRADAPPGIVATGDQIVDLDDQLAELAALRGEGKIDGIGLSNVSAEQIRQALPVGVACVQNAYSLLGRSGEAELELCREHDIAWVPYFPLGSSFPGWPKVTEHEAVVSIATRLSVTPAQVGLAWLLAHAPNVLLIPGTSDLEHLAQNVAAGTVELDADAMEELDALGG